MSTSNDFLNALQNQKPDEAWELVDSGDVEAEEAWKGFLLEYDTGPDRELFDDEFRENVLNR